MLAENLDDTADERKDAALSLIERGFYVLPVKANEKRPDPLLAPGGFKGATRDYLQAADWWSVKPRANVGVACGTDYDLVVIDIDCKNGAPGMTTYAELGLGNYPTLTANTPSGGFHLYFKHPQRELPATLPGIDIKGANGGGYVLAPPSTLPNGAYAWRDAEMPIAEFPAQLLTQKARAAAKTGPVTTITVPEGRRHARLIELGAVYRGKGLEPDEILTLLWDHASRYFDPPFSRDNPQHVRELEAVVGWYGGKAAPQADDTALAILTTPQLLARAEQVPDRLLLDPVLPAAGNLLAYGPSGHGKSHLALSMALALTRGRALLDWRTPEPVTVLFVDGEMPLPELRSRLLQYLAGEAAPENLHWLAARAQEGDLPNLADPAAQAQYLAAIETCGARVVIFDNMTALRSTSADLPENSVEAWLPVARFIRQLNRAGIAVVLIHHSAKSGTQRGSSAHTAVMDVVLRVTQPGEGQADPLAELDVEIHFEKHRRFGGAAAQMLRAKVIGDHDGFAAWQLAGDDPLVDQVVPLVLAGDSQVVIARKLKRSRRGIQKAIERAKARGRLPLGSGA